MEIRTKSMWKDKRGVLESLGDLGSGVLYVIILLAVGVLVLANISSNGTVAANTNATATVNTGINAVQGLSGWVPVVIIVGVAAVLIALVSRFRTGQ